ncbi:hypothetical protein SHEWT2_01219 [Shewanella hafniensis]|nr:hypothetical protein SHEWT2_01219 [Shewanella hafniensis]
MSQKKIVINCRAHDGYRRAGIAFTKGQNVFSESELTDAQLQAIEGDARLVVSVEANETQDDTSAGKAQTANVAQTKGSVGTANSADGVTELTGSIAGVVTIDGLQKTLAEMTVADLKELAESLEIAGFKGMKKPELVAAIVAVQVKVPVDAQNDATSDAATTLTTEQGA